LGDRGDVAAKGPGLLFGVAAGKDAGHEIQHIGSTDFAIAIIIDQTAFDHIDLFLGIFVYHAGDEASQFDRVLLVFKELQFQGFQQPLVGLVIESLAIEGPVRRYSS
jgi:hypothetical protein